MTFIVGVVVWCVWCVCQTHGGTWSFEDIARDRRGATVGTFTSVTGHVCFKGTADMAEEVRTTFGHKGLQKIHAQLPRHHNAAQSTAYIKVSEAHTP